MITQVRHALLLAGATLLVAAGGAQQPVQAPAGTIVTQTAQPDPQTPSLTKKQMKEQRQQQKQQEKAASEAAKAQKDQASALKHQDKAMDAQEKAQPTGSGAAPAQAPPPQQ